MKRSRTVTLLLALLFLIVVCWWTAFAWQTFGSQAKNDPVSETKKKPRGLTDSDKEANAIQALVAERNELEVAIEMLKREKAALEAPVSGRATPARVSRSTWKPVVAAKQAQVPVDSINNKNKKLAINRAAFPHEGSFYEEKGELEYVKFAMANAGYNDWEMPEATGDKCVPSEEGQAEAAAGKLNRCLPVTARKNVRNELFFVAPHLEQKEAGGDKTASLEADATTRRVRRVIESLDTSIANHPGVQSQKSSLSTTGTARGWGITSPYTNKWRFYAKHLQTVIDRVKPLNRPVEICEVGFLAGHSMAVDVGVIGNSVPARFHIFDFVQQGTYYAHAGSKHFKELLGDDFTIDFGLSRDAIPKALARAKSPVDGMQPLTHCDFVSLDGSKLVTDYLQDLTNLALVTDEDTIFIDDDHDPEASTETPAMGPKKQIHNHNDLFRWLLGNNMTEVIELFHAEEVDWKGFGNIAYRLKATSQTLQSTVAPLIVSHYCNHKRFSKGEVFEQEWCNKFVRLRK